MAAALRTAAALLAIALLAAGEEAERYAFLPKEPKWLTANLDLRDAAGVLWPNFIGGRNAEGEVTLDAAGVRGAFSVRFAEHSQIEGGQERRVLGDAVVAKPEAVLTVRSLQAAVAVAEAEELDRALGGGGGRKQPAKRPEPPKQAALAGELAFLGRTVPISATVALRRDGDRLFITGSTEVPGAALGLRPERVQLSFGLTGYRSAADRKARLATPEMELDLGKER